MTNTPYTATLTPACQVKIERPRFMLDGIIPLQVLTALTGVAGEGKSSLALHWAANATRGQLPGEFQGHTVTVAISATEDAKPLQVARLKAAGADLDRVVFLDMTTHVAGDDLEVPLCFPRDLEQVRPALKESGARLWIIDPVTGIIPGDSNKRDDVRAALDPLHALARELDLAVIGIAHFNKGMGRSRDKISGSHAFRDVARAHIPLVQDEETGHRVYTLEKANYSTEVGQSWSFDLVDTEVETSTGEVMHVARVVELGESPVSVDQIINRDVTEGTDRDDRDEAARWLEDYLREHGEVASNDVKAAGKKDAGISERTLKRAAQEIGIEYMPRGFPRKTYWSLPTVGPRSNGPSVSGPTGPTGPTGADQHRHSRQTGPETQLGHTLERGPTGDNPLLPDAPTGPLTFTADQLGLVVGNHPVYGPVRFTKIGLVPAETSLHAAWRTAGEPDLATDLEGAAA